MEKETSKKKKVVVVLLIVICLSVGFYFFFNIFEGMTGHTVNEIVNKNEIDSCLSKKSIILFISVPDASEYLRAYRKIN